MSEIKTIKASNDGSEKSETYRLLNIVHSMAGSCAVASIGSWRLKDTCTTDYYIKTTWTNGIVDVIGESFPDYGEHIYTLVKCQEVSNDSADGN